MLERLGSTTTGQGLPSRCRSSGGDAAHHAPPPRRRRPGVLLFSAHKFAGQPRVGRRRRHRRARAHARGARRARSRSTPACRRPTARGSSPLSRRRAPRRRQLIGAVDGLVTISTASAPGAPWVGQAQQGTDRVVLQHRLPRRRAHAGPRPGRPARARPHRRLRARARRDDRAARRRAAVERHLRDAPSRGDCTAPQERFADTFAKWALRGAVSSAGAGYGLLTPASLETWGAAARADRGRAAGSEVAGHQLADPGGLADLAARARTRACRA